jgi:hypothetical protein
MTPVQGVGVTVAVFISALAIGSVGPTLLDSWRQSAASQARTALDVEISRERIAITGSIIVPQWMRDAIRSVQAAEAR